MDKWQRGINEDKWYRTWWVWTPDMVVAHKSVPKTVARMIEFANNRCVIGFYRYELPRFGRPTRVNGKDWDLVGRATQRMSDYRDTGNKEYLIDAFNYLRWEFDSPGHPTPHFTPDDQGRDD